MIPAFALRGLKLLPGVTSNEGKTGAPLEMSPLPVNLSQMFEQSSR